MMIDLVFYQLMLTVVELPTYFFCVYDPFHRSQAMSFTACIGDLLYKLFVIEGALRTRYRR